MRPGLAGPLALCVVLVLSTGCRTLGPHGHHCDCASVLATPTAECALDLAPALPAPPRPVENLVFEGGGVWGTAYAGSLQVLASAELLWDVRQVAGTSAGSIAALVVALGYTADEIQGILLGLDFEKFVDGSVFRDVESLFDRYGWHEARYATCLFECLVERKLGARDATFADLHARAQTDPSFRDLYVVATDLELEDWVVFSWERHGDVPLAEAVRASMAIPFFFTARSIGGDTFVDGGVLNNYPIELFSGGRAPGDSTLGFFLGARGEGREVTDLVVFTEDVFSTLLALQTDDVCASPDIIRRTVFIDTLGISFVDFGITPEQKCALIRSGAAGTESFLRSPPTRCPERLIRPRAWLPTPSDG